MAFTNVLTVIYRVIPHQINTEKRQFQPDPFRIERFFREMVVPMGISILAKFYCFKATRFLRADIQSCQKTRFLATSCLRKSGITSALIEIQSSFYAHFKANKMPFIVIYYTNIFSTVMFSRSSNLTLTFYFSKCGVLIFLKKYIVCILLLFKTLANIKLGLQWIGFCEAFYCEESHHSY
jgi:hypothetical protein